MQIKMRQLLLTFSWQELRHHPWRHAAAVLAVMLGVALAFAVHVINSSALDEFAQAVRAVNGQLVETHADGTEKVVRTIHSPVKVAMGAKFKLKPRVTAAG